MAAGLGVTGDEVFEYPTVCTEYHGVMSSDEAGSLSHAFFVHGFSDSVCLGYNSSS